jgi:hypothetical protein
VVDFACLIDTQCRAQEEKFPNSQTSTGRRKPKQNKKNPSKKTQDQRREIKSINLHAGVPETKNKNKNKTPKIHHNRDSLNHPAP